MAKKRKAKDAYTKRADNLAYVDLNRLQKFGDLNRTTESAN